MNDLTDVAEKTRGGYCRVGTWQRFECDATGRLKKVMDDTSNEKELGQTCNSQRFSRYNRSAICFAYISLVSVTSLSFAASHRRLTTDGSTLTILAIWVNKAPKSREHRIRTSLAMTACADFAFEQNFSLVKPKAVSTAAIIASAIPVDGLASVSFDAANNRINSSGWQYDGAGNIKRGLAEDGTTWLKYEYDAANRVKDINVDDTNQTLLHSYQYGSTNQRLIDYNPTVTGLNTFYAAVGGTVLAEYTEYTQNTLSWTKTYSYLGSRQLSTITPNGTSSETTVYNHPDRLGTKVLTNQSAGTTAEQAVLPFGKALNAESTITTNNNRFTSYDRSSASGLDYAVNRYYSAGQSRFTQVDPLGMGAASVGDPQSNNLYAYTQNMPTDFVDPSGLEIVQVGNRTYYCLDNADRWDPATGTVYGGPCFDITYFHSGGGSSPTGGGGGGNPNPHPAPSPTPAPCNSRQQKAYDDCVKRAWRDFQTDYARRGALTFSGTVLMAAPVVAGIFSGGTETAVHVAATVGRPAVPLGMVLIGEAIGGPNAAEARDNRVRDCLRQSPGATPRWDDFGIG